MQQIFVLLPSGTTVAFVTDPNDTLSEIINRVVSASGSNGMDRDEIFILFDGNELYPTNRMTLADAGITDRATVRLASGTPPLWCARKYRH